MPSSLSSLVLLLFVFAEEFSHNLRKGYLRLLNKQVPLHLRYWWGGLTRKDYFGEAMRRPKDVVEMHLSEAANPVFTVEFPNGLHYILGKGDVGMERYAALTGRIHWYAEIPPERKYHPPVQDPEMKAIPVFGPEHKMTAVPVAEFSLTQHASVITSLLPNDAPAELWQLTDIPGAPRSEALTMEVIEVWGGDSEKRRND